MNGLYDYRNSMKRRSFLNAPGSRKSLSAIGNKPDNTLGALRGLLFPTKEQPGFEENPRIAPSFEVDPGLARPPYQEQPKTGLYDYWKQPVIGGKGGKGGLPLDLGVTLAGMLAQAIAPNEWGGRMGAGLAQLGSQAYGKRMEYEEEAPLRGLQERYYGAQIKKLEEPETKALTEFQTYMEGDEATRALVERYRASGRAEGTDRGVNKIDGIWWEGIWKGDKFIPRRESAPAEIAKLDTEVAEGKTLIERDPDLWRQQEEEAAKIKAKYRAPTAGEKPEYTAKQAMSRISTIDSTIARLKTTGTVDTGMAIQNPMLAGLVDTKDPAAVNQAIASLEAERAEIIPYAPKGYGAKPKTAGVTMGQLWGEVANTGSASAGVEYLKKTYNYNDQQAKDIIRKGIKAGKIR